MHEYMKIVIMIKYLALIFASVLFIGCNTKSNLEGVNFDTAEHYDSFLFVSAKNKPITKRIELNFNDWARYNNSHVTLMMCYKKDADLAYFGTDSSPLVTLYLNGEKCVDGKINLDATTDKIINLKIEFAPDAEAKMYTGYIVVADSKIDRINNIDNISNQSKIFEWNVRYKILTNPLKRILLWVLSICIIVIFIWFVFIRNVIYKKMNKGRIVINSPYSKAIKINGARQLVLTNKAKQQSKWSKILAGKILYEVNPVWDSEIDFAPKDKRSVRIKTGLNYIISPYTNQLVRGRSYEIKKGTEIIKISFL